MVTDAWTHTNVQGIAAPVANALVTGPFGSKISSRYFQDLGVPVIRGSNLSERVDLRLIENNLTFVSEEKATEFQRSIARKGDLIFTCWGTIGQVGLVDDRATYSEYVISNKQMKLTPDPQKADSLFLYYLFSGPEMYGTITGQAIGSSVPGFNLGQLRSLRLYLPSLCEQRAIAQILGTLDDKIELNRRMNETLERIARAIFKSWFVDFDPVHAKAAGRQPPGLDPETAALFPDRFEDSPLGPIPKGWRDGTIADLAALEKDGITPGDFPDELFDHYSIPAFDEGRVPKPDPGTDIKSNKFLVPSGAVLLSKLNPRIPRVWLPGESSDRRAICSTEFLVTIPAPCVSNEYVFFLFCSRTFMDVFATLVTGTSGSHQRVKPEYLMRMNTVVPAKPCVVAFTRQANPLLCRVNRNRDESLTLAAIRDALLPKLLSGEIRVKDAERFVESAMDDSPSTRTAPHAPRTEVTAGPKAANRRVIRESPGSASDAGEVRETRPRRAAERKAARSEAARKAWDTRRARQPKPDTNGEPQKFEDIETDEVMAAFRKAYDGRGKLPEDDLLRLTARRLGFQRLGKSIKHGLKGHLRAAIRRKILVRKRAIIELETFRLDEYTRDELVAAIRAVTRRGQTIEPEELIRNVVRHLGFHRATDQARVALETALTQIRGPSYV